MCEPNETVLLAEYQAAVASFHHYDSFRWRAGSLLFASSLVVWGLLFDNSTTPKIIGITSIFITALLSAWLFFAHHYRQLYITKIHRIHEIEHRLGMELNLRLGFLGKWEEEKYKKVEGRKYEIFGCKGHDLDIFIYVIISLFGPVMSGLQHHSFSLWLVLPLPIIAFSIRQVGRNEKQMREHLKKIMEKGGNSSALEGGEMGFLNGLIFIFYNLLTLLVGAVFVGASLGIITLEKSQEIISRIYQDGDLRLYLGASGLLVIIISLSVIQLAVNRIRRGRGIILENADGQISISSKKGSKKGTDTFY